MRVHTMNKPNIHNIQIDIPCVLFRSLQFLYRFILPAFKYPYHYVQLKAMGLPTICSPSDHSKRAKLVVPDGIEAAVNVTV